MSFTTAHDLPEEDPVSWTIEGSVDGAQWTVLSDIANYETPMERSTQTKWFTLKPQNVDEWAISKWLHSLGVVDLVAEMLGESADEEEQLQYIKDLDARDKFGFLGIVKKHKTEETLAQLLFEGAQKLRAAKASGVVELSSKFLQDSFELAFGGLEKRVGAPHPKLLEGMIWNWD